MSTVHTPLLGEPALFGPGGGPGRTFGGGAWPALRLDAHLATYGPAGDPARALERVRAAGLTGRGGAHFPAARKWEAALAAGGGGLAVANLAEGEPASAKDAALAQAQPHLVLDGLAAAAAATGAVRSVVWVKAGATRTLQSLGQALAERAARGLAVPELALAPDGFLSGESSAVVRALSGGPALPYAARVPAAVAGVGGRPTLVHNGETLARVALLDRGLDPGPALATVTTERGLVALQAAPGERLGDLVTRARPGADPQAVLVGGYGGRWAHWSHAAALTYSLDGLAAGGLDLGAGILLPAAEGACGLRLTAGIVDYLAASSARQCGPCLFGLAELAEGFQRLAAGRARRGDLDRLDQLAALVRGRGACHHPDGAAQLVASALQVFADDVARHRRGRCAHDAPRSRRLTRASRRALAGAPA